MKFGHSVKWKLNQKTIPECGTESYVRPINWILELLDKGDSKRIFDLCKSSIK